MYACIHLAFWTGVKPLIANPRACVARGRPDSHIFWCTSDVARRLDLDVDANDCGDLNSESWLDPLDIDLYDRYVVLFSIGNPQISLYPHVVLFRATRHPPKVFVGVLCDNVRLGD